MGFAGAGSIEILAISRGETVNALWMVVASVCVFAIGYRFHSTWIAANVLALNERRATPCEVHDDGKDFVNTNKWIVFGHHFAAIAGPGPLVGPVLAAQFGYLPGTCGFSSALRWAAQFRIDSYSARLGGGKTLGQMAGRN